MIIIDKLCYNSRLRKFNASVKALACVLTLIVCIADRSILISCLVFTVMSYLTLYKGKTPASYYFQLMRIPFIFLLLSTLAIMINISKNPMDAFAFPLGSFYLTSSKAALLYAVQLILTALSSVSCLYFLSLSTPITDILNVLKKVHLPELILELMLLVYRFIFLLFDIANALNTAQHARLGNVNFKTSCRSFGGLVSALFVRALKRSNALYDAMESRCYNGTLHVLSEDYPIQRKHLLMIAFLEIFLICIAVTSRYLGFHY